MSVQSQSTTVPSTLTIDNLRWQKSSRLSKLMIENFRNYHQATLEFNASNVVLTGLNGVGKTNLLEAISLLAPGRGMRRARREHLPNKLSGKNQWAVAGTLQVADGDVQVGSGVEADTTQSGRVMRLEGQNVSQRRCSSPEDNASNSHKWWRR